MKRKHVVLFYIFLFLQCYCFSQLSVVNDNSKYKAISLYELHESNTTMRIYNNVTLNKAIESFMGSSDPFWGLPTTCLYREIYAEYDYKTTVFTFSRANSIKLSESISKSTFSLGINIIEGVRIEDVYINSPAHRAGLKKEDFVLEFNNYRIFSMSDLTTALALSSSKRKIPIVIIRKERKITLYVNMEKGS